MTVTSATRHAGLGSSPQSSNDKGSVQNTPDTKLTAFSPEIVRKHQNVPSSSDTSRDVPPTFSLASQRLQASVSDASPSTVITDPFVMHRLAEHIDRTSQPSRFSPYAPSFAPSLPSTKISYDADSKTLINDSTQHTLLRNSDLSGPPTSVRSSFSKIGQFSAENIGTRYVALTQIPANILAPQIHGFFGKQSFASLRDIVVDDLAHTCRAYMSFADIRDAQKAFTRAKAISAEWMIQYMAAAQFILQHQKNTLSAEVIYEGQILVRADLMRTDQPFNVDAVSQAVKTVLCRHGDLMAMELGLISHEAKYASFRVEFYHVEAAKKAIRIIDGHDLGEWCLSVVQYLGTMECDRSERSRWITQNNVTAQLERHTPLTHHHYGSFQGSLNTAASMPSMLRAGPLPSFAQHRSGSKMPRPGPINTYPHSVYRMSGPPTPYTPMSSSYSPRGWSHQSSPGVIGQERDFLREGGPLMPNSAYGLRGEGRSPGGVGELAVHHNVVSTERIRQGLDVRTTIMLRNIPNKIQQIDLKKILDESSFGKYDFMYLRIDFANNCNVGYAFINFEDPYYIVEFIEARAGRFWGCFNSDKVAEVSYATIQGKDCLVQKFRNSSVMLEHPSFRPKIFHTGNGPLAGTEINFPTPDNDQKMRRSIENAEHVGLFAPRAGQDYRDAQRRRRSQYDRGTRFAETEERLYIQGQLTSPGLPFPTPSPSPMGSYAATCATTPVLTPFTPTFARQSTIP